MNRRLTLLLFPLLAMLLNACQKDIDSFVPDPGQANGPDTTWYGNVSDAMPVAALRNSLLLEVTADSVDVGSSNDTITAASGLRCVFPAGSCVNSIGIPLTGFVKVEYAWLSKKGDMIRMNRPTTSLGRLLVSGGELMVRVKHKDTAVYIASASKLQLRYPSVNPVAAMQFFPGAESGSGFDWAINTDPANNQVAAGNQHYEISTNKTGWYNCAYFFDTAAITRSRVSVNIPSSYTNANTIAFIVFKDMNSVVGLSADVAARKFVSGKLPNGKEATLIVISKQANDYFFGKKAITIGVNSTELQTVDLTPVKSTLPAIGSELDNL